MSNGNQAIFEQILQQTEELIRGGAVPYLPYRRQIDLMNRNEAPEGAVEEFHDYPALSPAHETVSRVPSPTGNNMNETDTQPPTLTEQNVIDNVGSGVTSRDTTPEGCFRQSANRYPHALVKELKKRFREATARWPDRLPDGWLQQVANELGLTKTQVKSWVKTERNRAKIRARQRESHESSSDATNTQIANGNTDESPGTSGTR